MPETEISIKGAFNVTEESPREVAHARFSFANETIGGKFDLGVR